MQTLARLRAALAPEFGLFRGRPLLVGAVLLLAVVPTLYAVIYLGSVWDPYGSLKELPVAVACEDQGTTYRGEAVNVGQQVLAELERRRPFRLERMDSAEAARSAVRDGRAYFALVVPADFSAKAVPGQGGSPGELEVYASEGTSFMAATVGKRFGAELAHELNETLNQKRWAVVLGKLGQSRDGLAQLKDGARRLRDGARQLDDGAGRLAQGAGQLESGLGQAEAGAGQLAEGSGRLAQGSHRLAEGVGQLGDGARLMASKLPADADLEALAQGSATLAAKQGELTSGLGRLRAGAGQLQAGEHQLREGAGRVPVVGGRLAEGAGKLEAGLGQLGDGLARAEQGGQRLAEGQARLDQGVQRLTGGVKQLGGGVRTLAGKFPDAATLAQLPAGADQLAEGSQRLASGLGRLHPGSSQLAQGAAQLQDGSARLADGLDLLYQRIPDSVETPTGDAEGLAASVRSVSVISAPVPNNGSAFAPYFVALSLWVGAVTTTFVFSLRTVAEPLRSQPQAVKLLGKAAVPALVVLLQASLIGPALRLAGVPLPLGRFWLIAVLGSLTFLSVVLMLITVLGDAGKLVALLVLIVQLASAGGAFPIELAGGAYRALHPLLPVTDIVKALRAAMFGAYAGAWGGFVLRMVAVGALAWAVALTLGRRKWKYVPEAEYAPAVDL